jgi:hypothetical protein
MHITLTKFTANRDRLNMQNNEDLWYRIGYALEALRRQVPEGTRPGAQALGVDEGTRKPGTKGRGEVSHSLRLRRLPPVEHTSRKLLDALLAVGAGSLFARVLSAWPGRRRPGLFRLFKAGTAGAAAAFLAELVRPVISGKQPDGSLEEELTDILLSGAGRGLLFAAILEPRIPGPSLLKGTTYGALEYALSPWGGLEELAGPAAPHRKIPVLSVLLKNRANEDQFLEHVAFGVALALLYDR